MKLLFDQNRFHKLAFQLASLFPGSAHVRNFGLSRASDPTIWSHAALHGFVLVSKDTDFQQRAMLMGHPPKVIWVRLGNCQTAEVAALLRSKQAILLEFEIDPYAAFLALT